MAIVDAHVGFEIAEQVLLRDPLANCRTYKRRTTKAAADDEFEADFTLGVLLHVKADIVHAYRSAIRLARRHRDLELTRQGRKFRMEGRPLTDDLAPGARILDLVEIGAGEMIRRHVADAVTARLDGMHLDVGQHVQHVRHVGQFDPVVLHVLARREMRVALVIDVRNHGELAHLLGVQLAIRDGYTQHIGMQLQVDPVLQAQRLEVFFLELALETTLHLTAELLRALPDQRAIEFVVTVHYAAFFACSMPRSVSTRAIQRCTFGNSERSNPPSSATRV